MSESLANLERLLANQEITFGRHNIEVAKTLIKIAQSAMELRDHRKAETSFWRALEIFCKVYGEQHVDVLFCIEQLADIAEAQGDDMQATRLRQQAAQIKEKPMTKDALPPRTKVWSTQPKSAPPAPAAAKSPTQPPKTTLPTPVTYPCQTQPPKPAPPTSATSLSQTQPLPNSPQFAPACPHGYHPAECPLCIAVRTVGKVKAPSAPLVDSQLIPDAPSLVIVVKTTGEIVALGPNKIWIGRERMNDISLPNDAAVSASHAVIECAIGQYWIRPCTENDGLLVNGSAVTSKAALRSGDVIKIGTSELRVQ